MRVIGGITELPGPLPAPCVTIGVFDGVHLGHQRLLRHTVTAARALDGAAVAMTFEPHPAAVLNPEFAPPLITSRELKRRLIAACGIDLLIEQPFIPELAELSPEQFTARFLVAALQAKIVWIGHDFTFGKDRRGTPSLLRDLGLRHDFVVHRLPQLTVNGLAVSSTKIRAFLLQGQVTAANALLGRPHLVRGAVIEGDRRGRELGFPTANVVPREGLTPGDGIYVVLARTPDGKVYPAATNVGNRPTVGPGRAKIEAHLLDFAGDLYGQDLDLAFLGRLRDEQKFATLAELAAGIAAGVAAARDFAARWRETWPAGQAIFFAEGEMEGRQSWLGK